MAWMREDKCGFMATGDMLGANRLDVNASLYQRRKWLPNIASVEARAKARKIAVRSRLYINTLNAKLRG